MGKVSLFIQYILKSIQFFVQSDLEDSQITGLTPHFGRYFDLLLFDLGGNFYSTLPNE